MFSLRKIAAVGSVALLVGIGGAQSAYGTTAELSLDQSIFVWAIPDETAPAYDEAMYYVNTLTGETDLAGYSFQPAVADCPSTMPYGQCEYYVSGAALDYSTHETHLLVSGAAIDSMVYNVDTQTGAVSSPLTLTYNGANLFNMTGISYDPAGRLIGFKTNYASGMTSFYSVDLSNGVLTLVASIPKTSTGNNKLSSIAYAPDGTLYGFAAVYTGSPGSYTATGAAYTLDLTAQSAQSAFTTGTPISKASFDASGYLWFQSDLDNDRNTPPSLATLSTSDPSNVTIRGTMPASGGPFVVSDVPRPVAAIAPTVASGQQAAGTEIAFNAESVRNGSTWSMEVHSTPQVLATGTASMTGTVGSSVTLPAGLEAGNHQLILTTTAPNGQTVDQVVDFTVSASGAITYISTGFNALANTGVKTNYELAISGIALLSIVVGVTVVQLRNRRKILL